VDEDLNPEKAEDDFNIKEEIKKRMERRYVKYYEHWKDFEMLTCILAMIGLILAMIEVGVQDYSYSIF
jgi:hypothetical protein